MLYVPPDSFVNLASMWLPQTRLQSVGTKMTMLVPVDLAPRVMSAQPAPMLLSRAMKGSTRTICKHRVAILVLLGSNATNERHPTVMLRLVVYSSQTHALKGRIVQLILDQHHHYVL